MTKIEEVLKRKGYSITHLAKEIGCAKSSMSLYVSGKVTPSKERACKIADLLGLEAGELFERVEKQSKADPDTMTVGEAARAMKKSELFIRLGLQQGIFPFGYAVKTGQQKYSYFISRRKFVDSTGIEVAHD